MSAPDLAALFEAQSHVRRWQAECENAAARLELARRQEAAAVLLSQHEPVARLGIDRERLRVLLSFLVHTNKERLDREINRLLEEAPRP